MDYDGETKNSCPEEKNFKRRMKTPFQLETLERVYAEDRYPSEAVRAELSLHLNLSDKQLQMWFCHRRLKDRKGKDDEIPAGHKKQKTERLGSAFKGYPTVVLDSDGLDVGARNRLDVYNDDFGFEDHHRGTMWGSTSPYWKKSGGQETNTVPVKGNEALVGRVCNPQIAARNAAVAAVVSKLGKSVRDNGPALGVEFDPLPPGGFESSIEHKLEQRVIIAPQQPPNESRAAGQETGVIQAGGFELLPLPTEMKQKQRAAGMPGQQYLNAQHFPTAPQEFQFLPEQVTTKDDSYHRHLQLNLDERCYEPGPLSRVSSHRTFLPAHMRISMGDGCGLQQEKSHNVGISLFLQGESRASGLYAANGLGLDEAGQLGLCHRFDVEREGDVHQSVLRSTGTSQPFILSESLSLFQEHTNAHVEKKRKSKEMQVALESEAHVKRIRRDLERQEIVRRKKEEQVRRELEKLDREKQKEEERAKRELEKLDREKQKEEERANRERQREVERIQREQRRKIERQQKMLLKENKRMEKQHVKEELRKAKESARLKAAAERAAAKKLSKESTDTVDDEQLELLEAATAECMFPIDGLEDLNPQLMDISKVLSKQFPPAAVRMKVPLSIRPWNQLEHALGHLFMVWTFLTTFADVLGLWPFTLDEFTQALHDYDPWLLGEIHISLIKIIVKDVEDAAEAAASVAVGSQSAISLASGGHPHIVEAAYEWGFDIQEWKRHVSPLTWPEILRQFALAAGYGPKWKKCCTEMSKSEEDCEDHSKEENAVKFLRSGAAAASAVALMQGKGVGHLRKGQYRLTPGTVKYAAFHILSLEGSKGLTILEVAEKIQKSGLRDLTTSKSPEASIAAALSRDTNLFERVAPSTYSVRPAFRKGAEDTEEVLQLARERVHLFQSGFLDVEEAEKETDEVEGVESIGDYDSDGQDVEDGDVGAFLLKDSDIKDEMQQDKFITEGATDEELEIDESQVGEPWVQGLMEGEYSDLSVEDRLMALVALVNVVNEGNSIRFALEARVEAGSALKRQIWAEAQIGRRRHKEEQLSRLQSTPLPAVNEGGDLLGPVDVGCTPDLTAGKADYSISKTENETPVEPNLVPDESSNVHENLSLSEVNLSSQEKSSALHDKNIIFQEGLVPQESVIAPGHVAEKFRAQVKTNIGIWAEELYVIRSVPLGLDRRRNRYWQFVTRTGGQDLSQGRIYFESSLDGHWGVIDTEEALDALMMSLDSRGTREAALHTVLVRLEGSLRLAMRNAIVCASYPDVCNMDTMPEPANIVTNLDSIQGGGGAGVLCNTIVKDRPFLRGLEMEAMEGLGAIAVNLGKTDAEKHLLYKNFKHFKQWIWSEHSRILSAWRVAKCGRKRESDLLLLCVKCHDFYWATDKHCQFCQPTFAKSQMKQDLRTMEWEEKSQKDPGWRFAGSLTAVPSRIQILKADIISMEVLVPAEAFKDSWDQHHRKAWASSLRGAIAPTQLLQSLTELESSVKQDWLTSSDDMSESLCASKTCSIAVESFHPPWVPHTSAAVGLRVMKFDAYLGCTSEEKKKWQTQEEDRNKLMLPSVGVIASQTSDLSAGDNQANDEDTAILGNVIGSSVRGRGQGGHKGRISRSSKASNAKPGSLKKGPKCKLQFQEGHATAAKRNMNPPGKLRGQGCSRGRLRSHSIGRAQKRVSRGGHQNQLRNRRFKKQPKGKRQNVPVMQKSLLEQATMFEEGPGGEPASKVDDFSKDELEESEDPTGMEANEGNRSDIEEDNENGEDEVQTDHPDEDGQTEQDDEGGLADECEDEVYDHEQGQYENESHGRKVQGEDFDFEEACQQESEEENEDLDL